MYDEISGGKSETLLVFVQVMSYQTMWKMLTLFVLLTTFPININKNRSQNMSCNYFQLAPETVIVC